VGVPPGVSGLDFERLHVLLVVGDEFLGIVGRVGAGRLGGEHSSHGGASGNQERTAIGHGPSPGEPSTVRCRVSVHVEYTHFPSTSAGGNSKRTSRPQAPTNAVASAAS